MFHIYCTSVCSCYHVAAFAIPLMWSISMFWKSWILTFWGERGGAAGKIFATLLLHSRFPLIWYATWLCSAKVKFDLLTLGEGGGGWGQNNCYHVTAFVIAFNFICNMTMFWKSLILPLTPPPKSSQGSDTGLRSKVRFDMFLIYCTSVCICYHVAAFAIPFDMQLIMFWKRLILTFWPPGGLRGKYLLPCRCICFVCLFDLIFYVHSTIFQLCGTGLPGLNQY